MKTYYYPQSVFKTTIGFSDLFNDITVKNFSDMDGTARQTINVPVTLDTKEKVLYYISDEGQKQLRPGEQGIYLPRVSISLAGIQFDRERKTGSNLKREIKIVYSQDNGEITELTSDYMPCAVNISYLVSIYAKYMEHGIQLLEQIIPAFDSHIDLFIKEYGLNITRKATATLEGINYSPTLEVDMPSRRVIIWDLNFNVQTVLYKPLKLESGIIKTIQLDFLCENETGLPPREGERETLTLANDEATVIKTIQSRLIQYPDLSTEIVP